MGIGLDLVDSALDSRGVLRLFGWRHRSVGHVLVAIGVVHVKGKRANLTVVGQLHETAALLV